ncbi:sugar phosphate isomerase/epimerase family protein [Pedobacter psychroterrae]|uniref:Sugar phosphate isomerase/epimerase n=1 Tax=Pedobacter psychroterrae TaxID=2530453 RepID=A0A4R0NPW0_9SPHI|nr:sugar phosphate isomerase/epimerase family protein [Pedobacter psychroterrae]TCD01134.1 sugar phosphate isomerase/epimerase [Pedobacter psychroterrae]
MTSRRNFLYKGMVGLAAGTVVGTVSAFANATGQKTAEKEASNTEASNDKFKLAIAGFSFVNFKLDESLKMMKKVDAHFLCIKDFHLPYNSTVEQIAAFHATLKENGVTGYAVGPIYTKTRKDIDNAFDYAKRVGVDLIIGIPEHADLEYLSQKTKESNIRYAIHNHGPEDKLYPTAESIYNLIKDLDPRVGICFDMGHNARAGKDSVADLQKYAKRIFDMHLKNVTKGIKEGTTCELGRGVINIPAFVRMLRKVKYTGHCALEYEKDMKDPLAGIAESVGYFRGICDAGK